MCQGENGAFLSPGARFCSHLTGCKSSLQMIVLFFKTPSHEPGPLMSTSEGKHPLWLLECHLKGAGKIKQRIPHLNLTAAGNGYC